MGMRLSFQILAGLLVACLCIGIGSGEYVRHIESNRLEENLKVQTDRTIALVSGLTIEAIVTEDIPLVESAFQEAVKAVPAIRAISLENAEGEPIVRWPRAVPATRVDEVMHVKPITVEGEVFGNIAIYWLTGADRNRIEASVRQARLYTIGPLILLIAIFSFMVSKLILQPMSQIHARVESLTGTPSDTFLRLPRYLAQEFLSFARTVNWLSAELLERQEREAELQKARLASEAAARAKSEFLANMSHEIRTPMNGVIGMSELLLESTLNREQRVYAETIASSGSSLLTIINDILDFSKIEAGKMTLNAHPFDLQAIIEDVLSLVASDAHQKGLEVILRYAPSLPQWYLGDAGRVQQIVTNLVGNAVKFTHTGHILVEVSPGSGERSEQLVIRVHDTGVGIPEEDLTSIFTEFEQVNGAANRAFQGTGLGLAITKRLVEQMGGEISATSTFGAGATFTLTLTLPEQEPPVADSSSATFDFTGKKVIVVDDLAVNTLALSERLRGWGFKVTVAESGKDAMALMCAAANERSPFDIGILDLHMPEMDGIELCKRLKSERLTDAVPLVLLSSGSSTIDREELLDIGFAEFLLKPARAATLLETLCNVMRSAGRLEMSDEAENLVKAIPGTQSNDNSPATTADLPGIQILAAEDNKTNQLVLKSILKTQNVDLTFASDGIEALEAYKKTVPDIVLMDVSMPNMDGIEATRHIRTFELDGNIEACPIIALTANAMAGDREKCITSGMDAFLTKPIDREMLFKAIETWGKPRRAARLQSHDSATEAGQDATCVGNNNESAPMTNSDAIMDRSHVDGLIKDFGRDDFEEIFAAFCNDIETALPTLETSVRAGNAEDVRKILHLVKGCSANLGVTSLVELCDSMKSEVESGTFCTETASQKFPSVFSRARTAIQDRCRAA